MLFPFACVCDVSNNSRSHRINIWMKELRDVTSRGAKSFLSCLPFESNVCSFKHRPQMAFRRKWKSNGSLFACSKKEDGVEDWTNRKKQESMHVSIPTKLFFFKGESSFFFFFIKFLFRCLTMANKFAFVNVNDEKRLLFCFVSTRRVENSFQSK